MNNLEMIESKVIEVDGTQYLFEAIKEGNNYTFKYQDTDKQWYKLQVVITGELIHDLKGIMGLDLDEELANIMVEEMRLEISKVKDGEYWRSHNEQK